MRPYPFIIFHPFQSERNSPKFSLIVGRMAMRPTINEKIHQLFSKRTESVELVETRFLGKQNRAKMFRFLLS